MFEMAVAPVLVAWGPDNLTKDDTSEIIEIVKFG